MAVLRPNVRGAQRAAKGGGRKRGAAGRQRARDLRGIRALADSNRQIGSLAYEIGGAVVQLQVDVDAFLGRMKFAPSAID